MCFSRRFLTETVFAGSAALVEVCTLLSASLVVMCVGGQLYLASVPSRNYHLVAPRTRRLFVIIVPRSWKLEEPTVKVLKASSFRQTPKEQPSPFCISVIRGHGPIDIAVRSERSAHVPLLLFPLPYT